MLLIKNAKIIDGTGGLPFLGDVLVRDGLISEIGNLKNRKIEHVLDVNGQYLIPGIIDINTSSDHYFTLFSDKDQESFLSQGVTTIIGGHCGVSLAPSYSGEFYGMENWSIPHGHNVNWHGIDGLLKTIEKNGLGVNFGTFIGYNSVRGNILGDQKRDLTINEIKVAKKIITSGLEEGAIGISLGLGFIDGKSISHKEIVEALEPVKKMDRIFSVHLKNYKENLERSISDILNISESTGVTTLISHLNPIIGFEKSFGNAIGSLSKKSNNKIYFDSYASEWSLLPIQFMLPDWVKFGKVEDILNKIKEKNSREKIISEIEYFNPQNIQIAHSKILPHLEGKTIEDYSTNRGISAKEAILELLEKSKFQMSIFIKNINHDYALMNLLENNAVLSSNAPGFNFEKSGLNHERNLNIFSNFFKFSENSKKITIESAVRKTTSLPASILGIKNRGVIAKNFIADIAILDKNWKAREVFIKGKKVFSEGKSLNKLGGKILKK
ncbi:MAG: hypothetical protein EXS49_00205 [Candidatus Pacebacteria bacterium]|nr:hypothetical protein [Candidatus Paceibacterota bacterium]